jgi:hypothetical protein
MLALVVTVSAMVDLVLIFRRVPGSVAGGFYG